jgi:glutamine amidotransferase PdxT
VDEMSTDLAAIRVVLGVGIVAFGVIAGSVLLARAVRPSVERLAAVDLRVVASAFGEVASQITETRGRTSGAPRAPHSN